MIGEVVACYRGPFAEEKFWKGPDGLRPRRQEGVAGVLVAVHVGRSILIRQSAESYRHTARTSYNVTHSPDVQRQLLLRRCEAVVTDPIAAQTCLLGCTPGQLMEGFFVLEILCLELRDSPGNEEILGTMLCVLFHPLQDVSWHGEFTGGCGDKPA